MKVIFFTKYTRKGASSRLRTFQYLPYFEQHGFKCVVKPLFGNEYLSQVYSRKHHSKWLSFLGFFFRVIDIFTIWKYDRIVIEKELFPYFPAIFERVFSLLGRPFIVDYDDAIYHNYDASSNPVIRMLYSNKISVVMRNSYTVTAGNEYLSRKAIDAGSKHVMLLPTVIDITRYSIKKYNNTSVYTIGWIGSPITHKYLAALRPVFLELSARFNIKLKLIGANKGIGLPELEELVPWTEEGEVEQIQTFNVGIMPLEDNIWERGKCGYKLIQYMGCGIPVIGTPLGVNSLLIKQGINGYQATTIEEWTKHLTQLILGGSPLEISMGAAGRKIVEESYSLQVFAPEYAKVIRGEN